MLVRRRALSATVLVGAVLAGGVVVNGPASAAPDTTVVEFTGDAGDSLTHGQPRSFAPPATTIGLTGTASSLQVSVVGSETWDFTFQAPDGSTLEAGSTYTAVKPESANASVGGFDLAGTGGSCTTVDAAFEVLDIATDAETGDVTAFAASFNSHCNASGAMSHGVVYVHSSLSHAATSTLTFTAPPSSFAGGSLDVGGTLVGPGGPIAGASISLSRRDGGVTTPLTGAVTEADGTWTAVVPFGSNDAEYTAAYAGDADHAAVQKKLTVALRVPETSTMAFGGPGSTFVGTSVDLAGELSGPGGPIDGATIVLSRSDITGTATLPATVTGSDGTFSAHVAVGSSDATFTASYAGDAQHAAVFKNWLVTAVAPATSTLTISGPASALATSSVDLSGSLTGSSGAVAGATVTLARTDQSGTTALPSAVTGADGSWTATVALGLTDGTFTASYAGDPGHVAAQASRTVLATRLSSTITLAVPSSVARGLAYYVTGVLTSGGSPIAGELVSLRRTDLAGTRTISVLTNASGAYVLRDVPAVGGAVAWRASWAGDATHGTSSASRALTVTRLRATVSIRTSASVYSYGTRALITVHLGTTYNRRDVYVYARSLGTTSSSTRLVAHLKVNAAGNAVLSYTMRARTTFTVRFDGDYRYAAAAAATAPYVRAGIFVSVTGAYKKLGSTYLLHGVDPTVLISVAPSRPRTCFGATVQAYQYGRWSTVSTVACGRLDAASRGFVRMSSKRPLGIPFRMSVRVGNDTRSQSLAATSPWVYWQFT